MSRKTLFPATETARRAIFMLRVRVSLVLHSRGDEKRCKQHLAPGSIGLAMQKVPSPLHLPMTRYIDRKRSKSPARITHDGARDSL